MGLREDVEERYPSLLPLLKQPEIGRLLTQAVKNNWSPGKFQSEFIASKWFRGQSESQRRFWLLRQTDPGEAKQQIAAYKTQLAQAAAQYGVRIPDSILSSMARGGLSKGFEAAGPEMQYRFSKLAAKYGTTGARRTSARAVQQLARRDYMYKMSNKHAAYWGDQMARGLKSEADVRQILASRAAKMHPQFSSGLAQGQTMADMTDGYRQIIANELEIDPERIDFTEGRWSKVLGVRDAKSKEVRPMTNHEVLRMARKDSRWGDTMAGKEMQYSLVRKLSDIFGSRGFA